MQLSPFCCFDVSSAGTTGFGVVRGSAGLLCCVSWLWRAVLRSLLHQRMESHCRRPHRISLNKRETESCLFTLVFEVRLYLLIRFWFMILTTSKILLKLPVRSKGKENLIFFPCLIFFSWQTGRPWQKGACFSIFFPSYLGSSQVTLH